MGGVGGKDVIFIGNDHVINATSLTVLTQNINKILSTSEYYSQDIEKIACLNNVKLLCNFLAIVDRVLPVLCCWDDRCFGTIN